MAGEHTILVVEDDAQVRALIRGALTAGDLRIVEAARLGDVHRMITDAQPDVVLLDVHLPDGTGLDVLRQLDPRDRPAIIVLTAMGDEVDRVRGLELGAEDYVVKPFLPRELAARVRRLLRGGRQPPPRIDLGGLVVDLASHDVHVEDRVVQLTTLEFDLLAHLAQNPRRVYSHADLLRDVWRSSPEWQSSKTVTEHVRRLRTKLGPAPGGRHWIITVARSGYRLDPANRPDP